MYAAKLEIGAGVVPETGNEDVHVSIPMEVKNPALPMGWALKSATLTRKNLTVAQKNNLTEVFQAGERTGRKADPTDISKAMRRAKHSDGSAIFKKDDFLTPQQIAGFFSHLTAKKLTTRRGLLMTTLRYTRQTQRKPSKNLPRS